MADTPYTGAVVINGDVRNGSRLLLDEFVVQQVTGTPANIPIPVGDGASHPASAYYSSLAACQADYPAATALTNQIAQLALTNAIAACSSGAEVIVRAGSYRWDNSGGLWTITGFSGRLIFHPGAQILFTDNTQVGIKFQSCAGFELEGFTADYVTPPTLRGTSDGVLVMNQCADFTMRGCRILSSRNAGIVWNLCARGVAYDTKVTYTQADGFFQANCLDSLVDGCELEYTGDDSLPVHNFHRSFNPTISGNTLTSATHLLTNGQVIYFSAPGGISPVPLQQNNAAYSFPYLVANATANTFQLTAAAWSSSTPYIVGQIVVYSGSVYPSILAGINQNPASAGTYWTALASGSTVIPITAWPAYSGSTAYTVGQVVASGGLNYYCIQAGTGYTPASSPTYWQQYSYIVIVQEDVGATWSVMTAYATNQFATYAGILYQALQPSTGLRPDLNANITYWGLAYQQLSNGIFKGVISRGSAANGISSLGGMNAEFLACEVYDAALQGFTAATDGTFGSFVPSGVDADIPIQLNCGSQGQLIHGPTGTGAGQAGHPLDAVRVTDCASVKLRNMAPDAAGASGCSILIDCPSGDIELDNCSGFNAPYIGMFLTALRLHIPGKLRVENSGDRGIYAANCGTVISEGALYIKNCSQANSLNRAYDFDTIASLYCPAGIIIEDTQATPTCFRGRDSGVSFGIIGAISDLIVNSPGAAWNSGTGYTAGQLVTYSGILYEAIAGGTNHQPDISPTYWIAQQDNFVLDHGSPQLSIMGQNTSSTPQQLYVGNRYNAAAAGQPYPAFPPSEAPVIFALNQSPPTLITFGEAGTPGATGQNVWHFNWDGSEAFLDAVSQGVAARLISVSKSGGHVALGTDVDLGGVTGQIANNVLVAMNSAITDGGSSPLRSLLNITGDGTYATVSTAGTAVTWISGSKFPGSIAGASITIAGVSCTVSTWNSATSLTLTSSAGTQASAALIFPGNFFLQAITSGTFLSLFLQPQGGFTTLGPAGLKFNDGTVQLTAAPIPSSPLSTASGGTGANYASQTALINALMALVTWSGSLVGTGLSPTISASDAVIANLQAQVNALSSGKANHGTYSGSVTGAACSTTI